MPVLSKDEAEQYKVLGFLHPLRAFGPERAQELLARLDAVEAREGEDVWRRVRGKPHLLLTDLNHLMREPAILDAVEGVLGPDFLVWATARFAKPPGDPGFVSWHQDATYHGLSAPDVVTAWVALTPSTRRSGCLRVIPGSHLQPQLPHRDTADPANLLSRGQEVAVTVDEAAAVDIELQPGQFSLHHTMLVHGSEPNRSDVRRVGIAIQYAAAHVHQTTPFPDSATLVRGRDPFGHFLPDPVPGRDFDPRCQAFFDDLMVAFRQRSEFIAGLHRAEAG